MACGNATRFAEVSRAGAGTRQHHDLLGRRPPFDQPSKPGRKRLAAPRASSADDQHRPGAVLDDPSLGVRELHPEAGGVSLHRPNASGLRERDPMRGAEAWNGTV